MNSRFSTARARSFTWKGATRFRESFSALLLRLEITMGMADRRREMVIPDDRQRAGLRNVAKVRQPSVRSSYWSTANALFMA